MGRKRVSSKKSRFGIPKNMSLKDMGKTMRKQLTGVKKNMKKQHKSMY